MNKHILILIFFVLSMSLLLFSTTTSAATETFRATYKYVMGDNDTKNDAKTLCFMGAKRRLLEQVGTFITSQTEVNNFQLTKDEIKSYSSAFLNVEVEQEKVEAVGENSAIVMTLRTSVDKEEVKKNLNKLIKDSSLKNEIAQKNVKISNLENKIQKLQKTMTTSNYEKSFQLREQRKEAFYDLYTENENIKRTVAAWKARENSKSDVINSKALKIRTILSNVQIGMTPKEVMAIIKEIAAEKDYEPEKGEIEKTISTRLVNKSGVIFKHDILAFTFIYDEDLNTLSLDCICYYYKRFVFKNIVFKSKSNNILTDSQFMKGGFPKGFSSPDMSTVFAHNLYKYIWGTEPFKQ